MKEIKLFLMASFSTISIWTALSGDFSQAFGVVIIFWLIYWALAEISERIRWNDLAGIRRRVFRTRKDTKIDRTHKGIAQQQRYI